ncbi:hypothetical protein GE061_002849 [Apolygus lucorum]|uniref:Secreted protein n=1 Tax=Apolygus lucorum TaxID=248454 RepID=A0A8S9X694_APOLU|nr:hypothetical protein GE061_002849 [Apolygus lucorum]
MALLRCLSFACLILIPSPVPDIHQRQTGLPEAAFRKRNRLLTNWISSVSSSLLFAAASCLANCRRCANCLEPIAAVLDPDSYHEVDPTQRSSALI